MVLPVRLGDPRITVDDVVLPIPGQQSDQEGLQVKAGGLVESFVNDDVSPIECCFVWADEVLPGAHRNVQRLSNVDLS